MAIKTGALNDVYLTTKQVAEALGLSRSRVQQLIAAGEITPTDALRDNGRIVAYLFAQAEVERCKAQRRRALEAQLERIM